MAEFYVTIEQLKNIKEQLSQLNVQFKAEKEKLAETGATLNTMWEGEAKTKFTDEFNKDQIQMGNFYNAVANYITVLEAVISKYIEAETRNLEISSTRNY